MEQTKFNGSPEEISEQISQAIPPELQDAFARIVKAGMKVMFSEQTHDMMVEQLSAEGDLGKKAGESIAGLMLLLFKKSNETMPPQLIVPAGIYLLAEAADFIEKVTKEEIEPDMMANAIEVMTNIILEKMGVPKDKMNAAMMKAEQGGYQ